MAGWTDDELRRTAEAYLAMLGDARSGRPYSKAKVRRALIASHLPARSEQAIEYRMRNISAVLDELGRPTLPGYVPAKNVGRGVSARIRDVLTSLQLPPPITPGVTKPKAFEHDENAHPSAVPSRSPSGLSAIPPPMIYFNIGWMRNYAGPDSYDPTIGNHAYLGSHAHGAEAYNFAPEPGGLLYGYRPPGSRERVNIDRLGAAPGDDHIDGVTVVWIARERSSGASVIVGWYRNARVWRNAHPSDHVLNGERHAWSVQGQVADSVLVPVITRDFRVQSSRTAPGTGFGQKPTWYGHPDVDRRVWNYIRNFGATPLAKPGKPKRPPRNQDPELRREVERAAINHAKAYYRQLYGPEAVESVDVLAKGWDLEIACGGEPLLVEVKGLLRGELICELTPNEYKAMRAAVTRRRYIVYVVNNALAVAPDAPLPSVFIHEKGDVWRTADGRTLKVTEKTGAVLTCL